MEKKPGTVVSVNIGEKKGVSKKPVSGALLRKNFGVVGDAHSGTARQVSLMGWEDIKKWKDEKAKKIEIKPGDFAENITTAGINWSDVKVGDGINIGSRIKMKVVRIGKECHSDCRIKELVGDCIMPKKGIFAGVVESGKIKTGDLIEIVRYIPAEEKK